MSDVPDRPEPQGTAHRPRFVVVGIGADGWAGLSPRARSVLSTAQVIYGSSRQLSLLAPVPAEHRQWRSPMSTHLLEVLNASASAPTIHILASGDPMFHGIGTTIVRAVGAARVEVIPAPSSASLACARLGWDLATTRVVSAVTDEPEAVIPILTAGRRVLVLSRDATTPARIAELLVQRGFGQSEFTVLAQLAGPAERVTTTLADHWSRADSADVDSLNIVAIDVRGPRVSALPGHPEDEFVHDGQITKSAVRALTVCALIPAGTRTLWDVGAGSGSVAIEWLRADTDGQAVAFELRDDRAAAIAANAEAHGVSRRLAICGAGPDAFDDAPAPDTIFIGGGLNAELLHAAWAALRSGGRLVVNTVTIENQNLIVQWHLTHGGTLRRLSVETALPLGGFTAWRPALPIVQWIGDKTDQPREPDAPEHERKADQ